MIGTLLLVAAVSTAAADVPSDPVDHQLLFYASRHQSPPVLTTSAGAPVSYTDATSTLNTNLINNEHFLGLFSNLVRERTPERAVHAKGTGAFGYFEVTHDISNICKADFLSKVGKRTPIAIRFSSTKGSRGSNELAIDSRGYSVKFYTQEGNFDIAGFNTPVFSFKEPLQGHNAIRIGRPNPATNAIDPNMAWERTAYIPESIFISLYTLSGRGIPASYRHMPGFSCHTFQFVNKYGDIHYGRFHFLPTAGIKTLPNKEAESIGAKDPDYLTKDLHRHIANGNFPSWTMYLQILNQTDLEKEGPSEVIDITRVLPEHRYPLHKIGDLVLNRNPTNWFREVEQLLFCPCNTVPGIPGGLDKVYEARRLIYRDAQNYRLGGNANNIPVNCPLRVNTYDRDGIPPVTGDDGPNYFPNSFNGPQPYIEECTSGLVQILEKKADNFDQARDFYSNVLTAAERTTLVENIVSTLKKVNPFIQKRVLKLFDKVHPDLGSRVADEINSTSFDDAMFTIDF